MRVQRRFDYVLCGVGTLVACCAWATSAPAAIIDIDATVSTTVQELIDGSPASVSSDENQLNDGSSALPMRASGDLTSTDLQGALVSMGQSFSEFSDPARLDQPNPEEFALEVAAYSNSDSIAYSATSSATESRTVVFTTPGSTVAPPEIDFGLGLTQRIESRVFLNGAVLLWSTTLDASLEDTQAEFDITVTRDDTGAVLFETSLTVVGGTTGDVEVDTEGGIRFELLSLDDLADEGIDADTIAVLQGVERDGTLFVVAIPPQQHVYRYTVRADEPVVLTAQLNARIRSGPGGTGVAAAFGAPFANLANFVSEGLPGVNGEAVERSLNAATASREIGLVGDGDVINIGGNIMPNPPPLCGILGIEWAALSLVGIFLLRLSRSRR